ncbi:aminodeoxychorismate/anthranilate synthase component II [Halodesulfovibrio aestuarii]|uniref:Para-aminobenzoate synthetase component 2 n=1 Tax=Halodesulfovibrio aestuarii TaxID=126333 RepID=A0A8G2CAT3_9BACT|nr:aminodeoxychorismate/anthranilate synthase component II [Halodesulfovibrio aestuarii]SHJ39455.1 para-aminobenzoate synthetase component 2 [Halodesulfovibrio aestuarii]
MRIVLIDNNDSFTRNLEHLLVMATTFAPDIIPYGENGAALLTYPFEQSDLIVISPGPGHPAEYNAYNGVFESEKPVLGICMGMQIINNYFGGTTDRLPDCVHGKTDLLEINGELRTVARYHSLYLSSIGENLRVTSSLSGTNVPMIIEHQTRPVMGLQFHPESFLTEQGEWYIHHAMRFFGLS